MAFCQINAADFFAALPPVWPEEVRSRLAGTCSDRTICVLDDDPTGTQTVHDVPVLTRWDIDTLANELLRYERCFYILTNSRSLPPEGAAALAREIATNLKTAAARAGREITPISRSDSTLRGHYPLETDILDEVLGPFDATFLCFYFEAGGRYTVGDTHYVAEEKVLVPAADTPFAKDRAFGYAHSDLRQWVEEKSRGRIPASAVRSLPLDLLRGGGPQAVRDAILALPRGSICIVNSAHPRDMEVFAAGISLAEDTGRRYCFRSAAQLVAARLGQNAAELWTPQKSGPGGLVIVGSYVPKTTRQLECLLADSTIERLELDACGLLGPDRETILKAACTQINSWLAEKRDIVVYTSRELVPSTNAVHSLMQGRGISEALVALVTGLRSRPGYLIAKGGITSSDIACQGLGIRRALVLGQIVPGVPVWQAGGETRFPGLPYIVFPGNVGSPEALAEVVRLLRTA